MEENFNKHLGNKLKLRRLALGLTQTKVAKAINVTLIALATFVWVKPSANLLSLSLLPRCLLKFSSIQDPSLNKILIAVNRNRFVNASKII